MLTCFAHQSYNKFTAQLSMRWNDFIIIERTVFNSITSKLNVKVNWNAISFYSRWGIKLLNCWLIISVLYKLPWETLFCRPCLYSLYNVNIYSSVFYVWRNNWLLPLSLNNIIYMYILTTRFDRNVVSLFICSSFVRI